jgi:[ribosomal protein S5]-alanine N-acetyltransferase
MDRFATRRLSAERLRPSHLQEIQGMHEVPSVMASLGGVRSEDETRNFLATNLAHWERWGYGLWVFRDQAGAFVGRAGLRHIDLDGADEVELAYALMPEFWGRGLGTEIGQALLGLGLRHFQLTRIVALTLTTNRASERIMVKLGMEFERTTGHAGKPHVLYRIAATNAS